MSGACLRWSVNVVIPTSPLSMLMCAVLSAPHRQKPILIVAPSSVITNWQREFSTWGAFRVAIYHGLAEGRTAAVQSILHGTAEIMLTTYDTFRYKAWAEMERI
jgi:SNF2 family DNA or RNA helicase